MITVKAQYSKGKIIPEESAKLEWFKKRLEDGDIVELTIKKYQESRSGRAANYLHALLNRYSKALGLSMIHAKNEQCIVRGIALEYGPTFQPPAWGGHFVELYGKIWYRKTTKEYTITEMGRLIEGVLLSCQENGVDVDDLIIEYQAWYGRKTA